MKESKIHAPALFAEPSSGRGPKLGATGNGEPRTSMGPLLTIAELGEVPEDSSLNQHE